MQSLRLLLLSALSWGVLSCATGMEPNTRVVCAQRTPTVTGVLIESDQGLINWNIVREKGHAFAYVEAARGTSGTDAMFDRNWTAMRVAGLHRGAYQILQPNEDATLQAQAFVRAVRALGPSDLAPMLVLDAQVAPLSESVSASIQTWSTTVQNALGRAVVVHTNVQDWNALGTFATPGNAGLWLDQVTTRTCPSVPLAWSSWTFWTNAVGRLDNTMQSPMVELAQFNGDVATLDAFAGGAVPPLVSVEQGPTVESMITQGCSTTSVRGLSEQLVAQLQCQQPGLMKSIAMLPNVTLGSAVFPYLQTPAANALEQAARGSTINVNSALRTLPQQLLLYRWYQQSRCGIALAALPGRSNHESGIAVDIDNATTLRTSMEAAGFRWFGTADPVHFDFAGTTTDIRMQSVLAFQKLWNRNHPDDTIAEDGAYGPMTEMRLLRAPASGFIDGATCAPRSTEVFWSRAPTSNAYTFRLATDANVVRVVYRLDGVMLGEQQRSVSQDFALTTNITLDEMPHRLEVQGFDAMGSVANTAAGLVDATSGAGVLIRSVGGGEYEVGLERAPNEVASVEVMMDTTLLTDRLSGATRSARRAVRTIVSPSGSHMFTLTTFNADGTTRGTLRRTWTVP